MAVQIHAPWPVSALTLYAIIRNADGEVWNGAAFEAYLTANLATYDIPLTQQGTAARYYIAAFPAAIVAGVYSIVAHQQAGGAPAESDTLLTQDWYRWTGTSLEPVQTGDTFARVGTPAGASVSVDIAEITSRLPDAVLSGAVVADGGNTATIFLTNLPAEANNYYGDANGGMVLVFVQGATNQYQSRRIVSSQTSGANTTVTVEAAFDATPIGTDAFTVLGRITELS